jgi:hypothetical protein
MLRVCLIGPGKIDFHYNEVLGIDKKKISNEIEGLANALQNSDVDIALTPAKGICFEIAKKFNGNVIGIAPISDKHPGIGHLKEYMDAKVDGKKVFNEIIDSGNWPSHNLRIGLFGDCLLFLGKTPGSCGELSFSLYMYSVIKGLKKNVNQPSKTIHKDIRAGKNRDYVIFVYTPFLKDGKLSYEDEIYAIKFGIKIVYVNSFDELSRELKRLNEK